MRLVEIRSGAALFDLRGRPVTLGLRQSTLVRTTLQADGRGHFVTQALINGVPANAVIDTGATHGTVYGYAVPLTSVQVGDVVLRNVQGQVLDGGNETLGIVLIGMSFLQQVEMHRSGTVMTLSRPHLH